MGICLFMRRPADYLAESPLDYFRVPYARELRVTCGSNTGREAFLADWDVRFQKLYGSGIETVRMTPDEASICGTEMTYELRFSGTMRQIACLCWRGTAQGS